MHIEAESSKVFTVHRICGRYEIIGTVTCFPAPPPGTFSRLAELAVEQCIVETLRDRLVEDLLVSN